MINVGLTTGGRIFFGGLNELRAIAALSVIVHHIELSKHREKSPGLYNSLLRNFIEDLGQNGVYLFFVLSGFLITYLLLHELGSTGKIDVAKFYFRRVLRIWPLYYLLVFISLFLFVPLLRNVPLFQDTYYARLALMMNDPWPVLLLFILFLPNLALVLYKPVPGLSQSWSVGVEEQFYLMWPLLMNAFRKNIPRLLIGVMAVKFVLLVGMVASRSLVQHDAIEAAISFLKMLKIELMAMGGLGAYYLYHGHLSFLYRRWTPVFSMALVAMTILTLVFPVSYLLTGVLFLCIILVNINPQGGLVRNKVLSFLGDISYGIYMYHPIMMFFSFFIVNHYAEDLNIVTYNVLLYGLTLVLTILVSYLSYRYFESVFLKLKNKFEVIPSGKN